jgi:flagellar hook-associated protein 1 FlgK
MNSTFSGIEIGKRSLVAHTVGLNTIGHNLSNASVEGFSRQRVHFAPMDPLYRPQLNREETAGQLGQGMNAARIERVRDELLENRIVAQTSAEGYWEAREKFLLMLEQVYNEPTELSVRNLMDRFWDGWQELSQFPEQLAARHAVVERGRALVNGINLRYGELDGIRTMLDEEIQGAVVRINEITAEIAALNEEIVKVKAAGDNPNDWMDRRDLLVNELGTLIDITVDRRDPDEFSVYSAGFHIVQGRIARPFRTVGEPENEGYSQVVWGHSGQEATFRGGKLASYLELRDVDVRDEIQKLDNMTINFVDLVNEIHRDGYGINDRTGLDFFREYPSVNNVRGNYDSDGDGTFDVSYIFRMSGANELDAQSQIGLAGTMTLSGPEGRVEVPYFPTDTVSDVVMRINSSGAEVVARLNRQGRLTLKATPAADIDNPDFVMRHVEDSGQFLVGYAGLLSGSGPENAYDYGGPDAVLALRDEDTSYAVAPLSHPSGWVEVNRAIVAEPASIASGFGDVGQPAAIGDGAAALEIAQLRNKPVMVGQISTFDDYFADTVAEIGLKGEEAELALETQSLIMKDLRDTRQSISGVNIDEEMSQLIKFQHGYTAAARFVSEFNTMLETIINRMGV